MSYYQSAKVQQEKPKETTLSDATTTPISPQPVAPSPQEAVQPQQMVNPHPPQVGGGGGFLSSIGGDIVKAGKSAESDITQFAGGIFSDVKQGASAYEAATQPIRNLTQGPPLGTPAKYETVTTYKQGGPGAGLVPVESQRLVSPAEGPTSQQIARRADYIAAGIVPGGDIVETGVNAAKLGLAADIGGKLSLGAIYGGFTSALKGGSPEQVAESAAFSGALFGAGPLAGKAAGSIGESASQFLDRFRTPSTIEEPSGTYSGTVGGQPGVIETVKNAVSKSPQTPGFQLTDIPGSESSIPARSFGESYAQSKFGIEPTPEVSYEFEYKGPGRGFEYSAEQARQETFTRTGPAGPGGESAGGGGGIGGQAFEQEFTRLPPGSEFDATGRFRETFGQDTGPVNEFGFRGLTVPGLGSGPSVSEVSKVSGASGSAYKTILPQVQSSVNPPSSQSLGLTQGTGKTTTAPPSQGPGQVGSYIVGTIQGSGQRYGQGSGQQGSYIQGVTGQNQPPAPNVAVASLSLPPASVGYFPPVSAAPPLFANFMNPPSMPLESRKGRQSFGFREVKHPVGNILGGSAKDFEIGGAIPKGFKRKKGKRGI